MAIFHGKNSPDWTDMSNFVVHFTREYGGKSPYENILRILHSKTIKARNAFGIGKSEAPNTQSQKVACFSEVPLHLLSRFAEKRSSYGIVFPKDMVIHRKGNPILYAYKDHPATTALRAIMQQAKTVAEHAIWSVTPFVDAPGKYAHGSYFFEWEREWRAVGDYKFQTDEVALLILPEKQHEKARAFFKAAKKENTGPSYDCPFIDPYWKHKKIRKVLSDLNL